MDLLRRVTVGSPAHGGHCVARVDGRVVFVRHTAPGEVVDVRLTDAGEGRRFWRGDAVLVHEPSPERVPTRWPEAGPGGVGGGELAHLTLPAQRRWKEEVVRDALRRIGHLDLAHLGPLTVHPLGEDDEAEGLATRTRISLVLDGAGRAGMQRHRSHEVLALREMPLAVPALTALDLFGPERWAGLPPGTRLELVAPSNGPVRVLADGRSLDPADPAASWSASGRAGSGSGGRSAARRSRGRRPARGPSRVAREQVHAATGTLDYRVDAGGFWQVHRDAPAALVDAVLAAVQPAAGQRVVELYSGAGLFSLPLAQGVGASGRVDAVELSAGAVADARRNLHANPQAVLHEEAVSGPVVASLAAAGQVDAVVLDPPRSGAGVEVMAALAGLRPPRAVYVACDPAALARDLRTAVDHGYEVTSLTGYDLFPHTHHVECVAVLELAGR